MLTLLLFHIVITLVSLLSGFLFYHWVIPGERKNTGHRPIALYLVTGLISLTIVAQFVALFAPVNESLLAIVLATIIILVFLSKKTFLLFAKGFIGKTKCLSPASVIIFFSAWLLILFVNAGPIQMSDTEAYHIQSIKWLKEYGTVPGIVHLHERFAFNTSWFSLVALFEIPSGHLNYYTALNGALSVWAAGYFLLSLAGRNKTLFFAGIILFLVSVIAWPLLRGNAAGSNYDYITALVIIILFIEIIKDPPIKTAMQLPVEWLIWPAYLFTVRVINFPFLLLTLAAIVFFWKQKNYQLLIAGTGICLALVVPFLIRNVIVSGFIFYPSMALDWFNVDWKADYGKTRELLRYIKYYNRVGTGFLPLETTETMGHFRWIGPWLKYMYSNDKIIFFPGIAGLLCFPLFLKKMKAFITFPIRLLMAVVGIQLIVWVFVAPDPRFIYGCLWIGVCMLSMILFTSVPAIHVTRARSIALVFTFLTVAGYNILKVKTADALPGWIFPSLLPAPSLKTIVVDNIRLYIPEKALNNWSPRCYDTKLPCLYEADPALHARGASISDGFKLKK